MAARLGLNLRLEEVVVSRSSCRRCSEYLSRPKCQTADSPLRAATAAGYAAISSSVSKRFSHKEQTRSQSSKASSDVSGFPGCTHMSDVPRQRGVGQCRVSCSLMFELSVTSKTRSQSGQRLVATGWKAECFLCVRGEPEVETTFGGFMSVR